MISTSAGNKYAWFVVSLFPLLPDCKFLLHAYSSLLDTRPQCNWQASSSHSCSPAQPSRALCPQTVIRYWSVRPLKTGVAVARATDRPGNEAGVDLTSEEPPLRLTCVRLALLSPCSPPYPPPLLPASLRNPTLWPRSLTARTDSDFSYSDEPSIIPHTSKMGFFARPIQTIHIKPSNFSPFIYINHRGA